MPSKAAILSIGMSTPVGVNSAQTASSVRAGIARLIEQPMMNRSMEPFVVGTLPDDVLPQLDSPLINGAELTYRESRLLRIAMPGLNEVLTTLVGQSPVPLFLGLPESQTNIALDGDELLRLLEDLFEGRIDTEASQAVMRGRAAGILALQLAVAHLEQSSAEFAIAGGVDTFRDLHILGTLDRDGRASSTENLDGFVPGEGAAFLLLASQEYVERQEISPLAELYGLSVGFEPGHLASDEPYKGEGLAKVFEQLFSEISLPRPISEVYSSMNGESYWAKEWGVAFLRNSAAFDPDVRVNHPADCYGDPGAASGALLAGLASLAISRNLIESPVLAYSSSDLGDRGALLLGSAGQ